MKRFSFVQSFPSFPFRENRLWKSARYARTRRGLLYQWSVHSTIFRVIFRRTRCISLRIFLCVSFIISIRNIRLISFSFFFYQTLFTEFFITFRTRGKAGSTLDISHLFYFLRLSATKLLLKEHLSDITFM